MVVGVDVEAIFQPRGVRAKQRHRKDGAASACCRQVGTRSWLLVRPQRLANFVVVLVAASSGRDRVRRGRKVLAASPRSAMGTTIAREHENQQARGRREE